MYLLALHSLAADHGLTLSLFNNTALAGRPASTSVVPTPNYTHVSGDAPFSALMTGTLSVQRGFTYNFTCDFGGAVLGYVHIDGHLVCQTGANGPHKPAPASVISVAFDTPLPVLSATEWPVRFAVVHNGSASKPLSVGMSISRDSTAGLSTASAGWLEVALSPALPKVEVQRDELQAGLATGWAPWYDMSYTKLVRLPEGSALALMLCDGAGGNGSARCVQEVPAGHRGSNPRRAKSSVGGASMRGNRYSGGVTCVWCAVRVQARMDWGPRGQADVVMRVRLFMAPRTPGPAGHRWRCCSRIHIPHRDSRWRSTRARWTSAPRHSSWLGIGARAATTAASSRGVPLR